MITINAVGDIMLAQKVGEDIELKGADYLFSNVRDIFSKDDFTIGNLECPLSDKGVPVVRDDSDFLFRSSPDCARSLKGAGFNILCLANNHMLDYGPSALSDTIDNLRKSNIHYIGAGKNIDEACTPLILEKEGIKTAFLAFTFASKAKKSRPGCCPCDPKFMQKQIEYVKHNVDLVIVSIHNGIEYVDHPNRYLMSMFRGMVEAGADVVLGHHPHVVQGIEVYQGSLIAYSLGNFISSYMDEEVRKKSYQETALSYFTDHPPLIDDTRPTESMILKCQLDKEGFKDYQLIPIKSNDKFQPDLMDKHDAEVFLKRVEGLSEELSNLNAPVWDEMDDLWEKCKMHSLKNITNSTLVKNFHRIRLRHMRMLLPYLRERFKG